MKKSIYMLLPALCLLASCTDNTSSSTNSSNAGSSTNTGNVSSSPVASSTTTPSSSSSSTVPVVVIEPSELGVAAEYLYDANSSDRFVAPTAMHVVQNDSFSETYENFPEGENYVYEGTLEQAINLETGYLLQKMSDSDGVYESYSYASGTNYYLVENNYGVKTYYEVPCESSEEASAFAVAMLGQINAADTFISLAKGLDSLQSVVGFVEQYTVNNDEDPTNDINNDYQNYNISFDIANLDGSTFDATIGLDASNVLEEDGMVQESSINGNLHVAFENGYLTHSLDEATMIEKITMGEDYMSMTITSRQETSISYSFEATYPDLSDYTKGEL